MPKRIAAIKMRGLGDTILWAPALRKLKNDFPESRLAVFCPERWINLATLFPGVDEVHGLPPKSFWGLLAALRAYKPDLILAFHASPRLGLAALFSGASERLVRNHSGRDWFSTRPIPAPKEAKGAHLRDMDVVQALTSLRRGDGETGRGEAPQRAITFSEKRALLPGSDRSQPALLREGYLAMPVAAMEKARQLAQSWGDKAPVLLCPAASKVTNEWPADNWGALGRWMAEKGIIPVVHAGPGEQHWFSVFEEAGVPFHRLEAPDLVLLGAILAQSRLCLASDSGPKHLAAAVGCPTVTIWGSTLFREWHPYDPERHKAVLAPVPCRPCFRNTCDHLSCLRGIEPRHVQAALEGRL